MQKENFIRLRVKIINGLLLAKKKSKRAKKLLPLIARNLDERKTTYLEPIVTKS